MAGQVPGLPANCNFSGTLALTPTLSPEERGPRRPTSVSPASLFQVSAMVSLEQNNY
jgi:hypothetical protein